MLSTTACSGGPQQETGGGSASVHGLPDWVPVYPGARVAEIEMRAEGLGNTRALNLTGGGASGGPSRWTFRAVVRQLPGRRVVVTADRGLRERCVAAGAEIRGPGWLLGLLRG